MRAEKAYLHVLLHERAVVLLVENRVEIVKDNCHHELQKDPGTENGEEDAVNLTVKGKQRGGGLVEGKQREG